MVENKQLCSSVLTGGGGFNFEAHVQASFVTLMLTGGYAPCLACLPITGIKLQGKIDGFETDDLIVFVENNENNEQKKMLGQIKHSIKITQNDIFREVIQAAWNDFNNSKIFTKNKDIIALITGPLSKTDSEIFWLLNHARSHDSDTFFRNVETAVFISDTKRKKLETFRACLKIANEGKEVDDKLTHSFLSHFYLLGYDLGEEEGVTLSLINSHISQFERQLPRFVWSRILEFTNNRNQHAGYITRTKLPDDLVDIFITPSINTIPESFIKLQTNKTDWAHHRDATYLAFAVLIGAWDEKNKNDIEVLSQLFGINYEKWLQKAREMLICDDSPLSIKNGIWKVSNRIELWKQLGTYILDQNLNIFKSLVVAILKEPDSTFELPTNTNYAATIHEKTLTCSDILRKGIAEGLAILSNHSDAYHNQEMAEITTILCIREVLTNASWVVWGSLNRLLPIMAEAAPSEFLDLIEKTLRLTPCPFDQLFAQENKDFVRENYLTGLLWALEVLAWDEKYFFRACMALAELATHDPGGKWSNRPSNSLTTILLPWLPQTMASIEKRKVAVKALLKEWPDISWSLIVKLLPNQILTSSGSYKPIWRELIPDNAVKITQQEYWQQTSFYAELAVSTADYNIKRLSELINLCDKLPNTAFNQLIEILSSKTIIELREDQKLILWHALTKFINRHKRHSDSQWELHKDRIIAAENIAKKIAPSNPVNLYQHLFTNRDFELYDGDGDWEMQQKKLDQRREEAIREIFKKNSIEGIIQFAELVDSPYQVGNTLGFLEDEVIEETFLPHFLDTTNKKHSALISGFILRKYYIKGWTWCDNLDKSGWNPKQTALFLTLLPFNKETWDHVSAWLENPKEYWSRTSANAYQTDNNLTIAIEKLIEHDRPQSAINCLHRMLHANMPINAKQCTQALLLALSSKESNYSIDKYYIVELIKFLQIEPSTDQEELFNIEWGYLPLLDGYEGSPKLLERKLANNPEFFCEVIQWVYRSKKDEITKEPSAELKVLAMNAWQLLCNWKSPPGLQDGGSFNDEHFNKWLNKVIKICDESGHLDVALSNIGKVLIHTPADPSGLWIHQTVATALNDRKAADMCSGFRTGIYNSRGVHTVDPSGEPEKKLAEQFRYKAETIENAGFPRFAITLRELADEYEREAKRVIQRWAPSDEQL